MAFSINSTTLLILILSALLLGYWLYRWRYRLSGLLSKTETPETLKDQFVQIGNHNLRYWQQGSGKDLLLIHGIGASVYIWRFVFTLLSPKYRVTAIDLVGFGRSSAPDDFSYDLDGHSQCVAQAILALELKQPCLVGSSMGGAIALWLRHTCPELISKTLVLAPAVFSQLIWLPLPIIRQGLKFKKWLVNPIYKTQILKTVLYNHSLITPENTKIYFEPYTSANSPYLRSFIESLAVIKDPRLPHSLKAAPADKPVAIYWGEHDSLVPKSQMKKLSKQLKCPLIINAQSGHHPMEDAPTALCNFIVDFVESKHSTSP